MKTYFSQFMELCSFNYQKLNLLLGRDWQQGDKFSWRWEIGGIFTIIVEKQFQFTDELSVQYEGDANERWLTNFFALIRLYHDMHLCEVIAFQDNQGKIQHLSQTDIGKEQLPCEKWQMNRLLFEALSCCKREFRHNH